MNNFRGQDTEKKSRKKNNKCANLGRRKCPNNTEILR